MNERSARRQGGWNSVRRASCAPYCSRRLVDVLAGRAGRIRMFGRVRGLRHLVGVLVGVLRFRRGGVRDRRAVRYGLNGHLHPPCNSVDLSSGNDPIINRACLTSL